jgi:hypothetical protein
LLRFFKILLSFFFVAILFFEFIVLCLLVSSWNKGATITKTWDIVLGPGANTGWGSLPEIFRMNRTGWTILQWLQEKKENCLCGKKSSLCNFGQSDHKSLQECEMKDTNLGQFMS